MCKWAYVAMNLVVTAIAVAADPVAFEWSKMGSLQDSTGLAGAYAGVSGEWLIVAGGANFPDKMPWEGGKKTWHDEIYALARGHENWRKVGKLPHPLAYGISVTTSNGVLCIGGADGEKHFAEVFLISCDGDTSRTKEMPPLPMRMAYGAGALVGNEVYATCGSETPGERAASIRLFALDLAKVEDGWNELAPLPARARILPMAGAADGALYLAGGTALRKSGEKTERIYLRDAWRFDRRRKWERIADLPEPAAAAPTPMPLIENRLLLVGGDDGSLVNFRPFEKHPGFSKMIYGLDLKTGQWSRAGETPAPRATLTAVHWDGKWVFPSGEVRPGVRSPEVWAIRARDGEK